MVVTSSNGTNMLIQSGPFSFQWGTYYRLGDRIFVRSSKLTLPPGFTADISEGLNIKKEDDMYIFDVKVLGWGREYV